jgi:hypothetical protein
MLNISERPADSRYQAELRVVVWGKEAERLLQRILSWPACASDAGYGNIHWTNKNPRPGGKPFWVGKAFKSAAELVSFAGWLITKPNVLDIYYCTSLQGRTALSKSGKVIALRSLAKARSPSVDTFREEIAN